MFKAGRGTAHAFMNWQSKEQLDMEYILNAEAKVIDEHTIEVIGERFRADNLHSSVPARPPSFPTSPVLTCTVFTILPV
ncbi:MAG: hypothetical protein U0401_16255 [Anaerolineae bacterium]